MKPPTQFQWFRTQNQTDCASKFNFKNQLFGILGNNKKYTRCLSLNSTQRHKLEAVPFGTMNKPNPQILFWFKQNPTCQFQINPYKHCSLYFPNYRSIIQIFELRPQNGL